MYEGGCGVALAFLEAHRHLKDDSDADAATRAGCSIAAAIPSVEHASLYFGLTGIAFTLCAIDAVLSDARTKAAPTQALELVRSQFDGVRWNSAFELLAGNAGIAPGALACGDSELALLAVEPYLRTAEVTDHGVQWEDRVGEPSRLHHISHGTLGIVAALATQRRPPEDKRSYLTAPACRFAISCFWKTNRMMISGATPMIVPARYSPTDWMLLW